MFPATLWTRAASSAGPRPASRSRGVNSVGNRAIMKSGVTAIHEFESYRQTAGQSLRVVAIRDFFTRRGRRRCPLWLLIRSARSPMMKLSLNLFVTCFLLGILGGGGVLWGQFPKFEHRVIDPQIDQVCYGLTLADVNGDQRIDLVAVSNRAVYWYENPGWEKRTIIADQTIKDNVCIAPHDIDGDGRVDFALGAGWTGTGTIQWLSRPAEGDGNWNVYPIAEIRWTHRMRFADVLGTGQPQLVVSPLNRIAGTGVALTAFQIPENPRQDRWPPTVLNEQFNKLHNHWHPDLDQDGAVETLTASEEGVHWIRKTSDGFEAERLIEHPAGEIKSGSFVDGQRLLATIEPMHGNRAVAYVTVDGEQKRMVVDEQLQQGHAVWLANLDDDPEDEMIIGHREAGTGKVKGPGLYVFDYSRQTGEWEKHIIDNGGCAVEDALAADFDGDGRIDLAAGGRATHNVKIYFNRGPNGK